MPSRKLTSRDGWEAQVTYDFTYSRNPVTVNVRAPRQRRGRRRRRGRDRFSFVVADHAAWEHFVAIDTKYTLYRAFMFANPNHFELLQRLVRTARSRADITVAFNVAAAIYAENAPVRKKSTTS